MTNNRLSILLVQYAENRISAAETEELFRLIGEAADPAVSGELYHLLQQTRPLIEYDEARWAGTLRKAMEKGEAIRGAVPVMAPVVKRNFAWKRMAAAAAIGGLIIFGAYKFFSPAPTGTSPAVAIAEPVIKAPVSTKAAILLEDGTLISIDSLPVAVALKDVAVTRGADGTLVYAEEPAVSRMHLLSNPRGSKAVQVRLNDGTLVWLNAESSIRYPTVFSAVERRVEVEGEAYFEVAKDAARPFRVISAGVVTEVLGTHFNVNSYADNGPAKITLLEGRVKLVSDNAIVLLEPGEQGIGAARLHKIPVADVGAVIAWKNGYFAFTHQSISELVNELSRWYDINIHFDPALAGRRFGGGIARDANLNQVMQILEEAKINCRLEGRTLFLNK